MQLHSLYATLALLGCLFSVRGIHIITGASLTSLGRRSTFGDVAKARSVQYLGTTDTHSCQGWGQERTARRMGHLLLLAETPSAFASSLPSDPRLLVSVFDDSEWQQLPWHGPGMGMLCTLQCKGLGRPGQRSASC